MNVQEIRQNYPQYNDLSDNELATKLHQTFYSDLPYNQFAEKIGVNSAKPDLSTVDEAGLTVMAMKHGMEQIPMGWGDEAKAVYSGVASAVNPFVKEGYQEAYDNERMQQKAENMALEQNAPNRTLAYDMAGLMMSPGATSGMGMESRVGKIAVNSGIGAVMGAGTAEDGQKTEGALTGAAFGAALPIAIDGVGAVKSGLKTSIKGLGARSPEALQEVAKGIKSGAINFRDAMKQVDSTFTPEMNKTLVNNLDNALSNIEIIPELSPKTIAVVKKIKDVAGSGELNLDKLDQYGRMLRDTRGEDSAVAGAVRNSIRNTLDQVSFSGKSQEAVDLLNSFKSEYAKGSRFQDIADLVTKADGDPNKIKSYMTSFINKPENLRGFSKQEIELIKEAARSSAPEKLLKMMGKFGIDLGTSKTSGNTVAPLIGGLLNPVIPIAGTAARQGQKYLARGKVENLLKAIENGSNN